MEGYPTRIIYIATNLDTGKQYVGQTNDFQRRLQFHLRNRENNYFDNALKLHGLEKFTFIQFPCPECEADEWEKKWIADLGTFWPGGYNMTTGGHKNHKLSEDTKRKIGDANRGRKMPPEAIEKMRAAKIGKPQKPEAVSKRADALRGRRRPPHVIEAVRIANTGKRASEEARKKMRAAKLGKKRGPISEETRRRMSASQKNPSTEKRRKLSESKMGAKNPMYGKHVFYGKRSWE